MSLVLSIIGSLSFYFAGEAGAFFLFTRIYHFPFVFFLYFLAVHLFFQLTLMFFLILGRSQFYNLHSGEREAKVNIANKITLFRISMLPLLVFFLLALEYFPRIKTGPVLVIALALTFVTDIFDGKLARAKKLETYIGKILDSGSDYTLLGTTAISFYCFKLIKPWLFWIIIGRLFINALGMAILFLIKKKLRPQTTIFGKAAIAAIMVLLVLESAAAPLAGLSIKVLPQVIRYIEIAAGIFIGLSVADKVVYFIKSVKSEPKPG